jgi:hypothetical protein
MVAAGSTATTLARLCRWGGGEERKKKKRWVIDEEEDKVERSGSEPSIFKSN